MYSITATQLQQALMFGTEPLKENGMLVYTSGEGNFTITLLEKEDGRYLMVRPEESSFSRELKLNPTTGGGWIVKPLGGELECIQENDDGVSMHWHEGFGPRQFFDADRQLNVNWNGKKYAPTFVPNGPVEFGDFKVSKIVDPQLGETIHVDHVDGWALTVVRRQEQAALAACSAMGVKIVD